MAPKSSWHALCKRALSGGSVMEIAGRIHQWSKQSCRIEGALLSTCGKNLKITMGFIAPEGRIRLMLPVYIPAYSFLATIDAHFPGLQWKPEPLRIAVVRFFSVINDHNRCIGKIFQASAYDHHFTWSSGATTDWWYATVDGFVRGETLCASHETPVQFDLQLRRGWNAICRQRATSGVDRCRNAPLPLSSQWIFRPHDPSHATARVADGEEML